MRSVPMVQYLCEKCGGSLSGGDRFCMRCGAPVDPAPKPQSFCTKCGASFEGTEGFCMSCGAPRGEVRGMHQAISQPAMPPVVQDTAVAMGSQQGRQIVMPPQKLGLFSRTSRRLSSFPLLRSRQSSPLSASRSRLLCISPSMMTRKIPR